MFKSTVLFSFLLLTLGTDAQNVSVTTSKHSGGRVVTLPNNLIKWSYETTTIGEVYFGSPQLDTLHIDLNDGTHSYTIMSKELYFYDPTTSEMENRDGARFPCTVYCSVNGYTRYNFSDLTLTAYFVRSVYVGHTLETNTLKSE